MSPTSRITRITMRLAGGLGNQLFQYAAGRCAARETGATLALDVHGFARDPIGRRYALERLNLTAELSEPRGWPARLAEVPGLWRLARATGWSPRWGRRRLLFDRLRGYDRRLREGNWDTLAIGYWQDERYLLDGRDLLLAELDPTAGMAAATRALGDAFARERSTALHVRRGDFAAAGSGHGVCSEAYYRTALARLAQHGPLGTLRMFSDDPAAAARLAERISDGVPWTVVSGDLTRSELDELWLMSRCGGLIIANSSYSWWAAWLADRGGERAATLVACPARWYRPSAGPIPHPAPARWHRISAD